MLQPGGDPYVLCFVDFSNPSQAAVALDALQGEATVLIFLLIIVDLLDSFIFTFIFMLVDAIFCYAIGSLVIVCACCQFLYLGCLILLNNFVKFLHL